jgi:hypothetical protein
MVGARRKIKSEVYAHVARAKELFARFEPQADPRQYLTPNAELETDWERLLKGFE